jgi:hypothetical protein
MFKNCESTGELHIRIMRTFSWTLIDFSTQLLVSVPFFKSEMLLNSDTYWESSTGDMLANGLMNLSSKLRVTLRSPLRFQMKPLSVVWCHVPVCNIRHNDAVFFIIYFSSCPQMVKAYFSIHVIHWECSG